MDGLQRHRRQPRQECRSSQICLEQAQPFDRPEESATREPAIRLSVGRSGGLQGFADGSDGVARNPEGIDLFDDHPVQFAMSALRGFWNAMPIIGSLADMTRCAPKAVSIYALVSFAASKGQSQSATELSKIVCMALSVLRRNNAQMV